MGATVTRLPTALTRRPVQPCLTKRRALAADLPRIKYAGSDYWPNGQKKEPWPPVPINPRPAAEILLLSIVAAIAAVEDERSQRLRQLLAGAVLCVPDAELVEKASSLFDRPVPEDSANG